MISEKGLCAALNAAQTASGYCIAPRTIAGVNGARNDILLYTDTWAVSCPTAWIPPKAAALIVEHARMLPTMPVLVRSGSSNQLIQPDFAAARWAELGKLRDTSAQILTKLPLVYRDKWQLYRSPNSAVCAFDAARLQMMEGQAWTAYLTSPAGVGMWIEDEVCVYLSPMALTATDATRLRDIGQIDWTGADKPGAPADNMSLFDEEDKDK